MKPRTITRTPDLDRIKALPRRKLTNAYMQSLADELNTDTDLVEGEGTIRPKQAAAIYEAAMNRGGVFWLPVGSGKTFIYLMLAALSDAVRPLIIAPAPLHPQFLDEHAKYTALGFKLGSMPRLITSQALSIASGDSLLRTMQPDFIAIDEHSELSNSGLSGKKPAGCVLALDEYIQANPDTFVVAGDGTPSRWSILDYWHILAWCLKGGSPLPLDQSEAKRWALVVDDDSSGSTWGGGMKKIMHPGELGSNKAQAQSWLAKRMAETPGLIIVDEDSAADVKLTIKQVPAVECREIDEAFTRLGQTNETPGDEVVSDPLSKWRIDGQLGCGYYTYWDPPPPDHWRAAYRAKGRMVEEAIRSGKHFGGKRLRTEMPVINYFAGKPGAWGDIAREWLAVRKDFDPAKSARTEWVSTAVLEECAEWLHHNVGVIWCGGVDFALALSKISGISYYGRNGQNEQGRSLTHADPSKPIIASWNANKKGFNLQGWSLARVVQPPPSARWLEQLYGRHHRSGQKEDVVFELLVTSGLTLTTFEKALREAQHNKRTTTLTQKIMRADIVRCSPPSTATNSYRWARTD